MIFKKGLISLAILGTVGGTSAGVYYLKNQNNNQEIKTKQTENLPTTQSRAESNAEQVSQQNSKSLLPVDSIAPPQTKLQPEVSNGSLEPEKATEKISTTLIPQDTQPETDQSKTLEVTLTDTPTDNS